MKLITAYSGLKKEEVLAMSHKELQEAVIRMLSVETIRFEEGDSWNGVFLLPDELADAFRGNT